MFYLKIYSKFFKFLPISTSFIKEPITGFCQSKCFTFWSKSSVGFLFLIMLLEIGSSLLLKLASFNLLLVTYRSSSPCISSPKLLVANKNFFLSSLKGSLTICCWKLLFWEKSIPSRKSFWKESVKLLGRFYFIISSFLWILFRGREI